MNPLSHRQATARVRLMNTDGTICAGQEVQADQVSHRFLFGCGAFDTVDIMKTQDPAIVDLNDWQVDEWPSTPAYEARQAAEISEMYSVLFSHPLVEAITTWDFNDGCWLKAPSGFVHEDNSEKPSYYALQELIHGKWETHGTLTTDENGWLTLTGFKGGYKLRTKNGSGEIQLDGDTGDCTVTLE